MSIQIRKFRPEDHSAAMALWKRCEGMGLSDADSPCAIKKFLELNPGLSFVAEEDGVLIGTVLCGNDGRRGFLYHLAVDPSHRRQGLGRKLAETSLEALKAIGIQKCHIMVFQSNESGKAFWQSSGWVLRPEIALLSYSIEAGEGSSPC